MSDFATQVEAAVVAHSNWKRHLRQAIEQGKSDFQVETVQRDNACAFGQWLYGEGTTSFPSHDRYEEVKGLHARFHLAAAHVLSLAVGGQGTQATEAMEFGSEFAAVSAKLVSALAKTRDAAAA